MKDIINLQLDKNKDLNLLFTQLDKEVKIDENFKETLIKLKKEKIENIDELIDYTVKKTLEIIYEINQYLNISKKDIQSLRKIYLNTWDKIKGTGVNEILIQHHKELSEWISKFYTEEFIKILKENSKIGKVINNEYSIAFQKYVLDLTNEELTEPIIDIGCGKNGKLVKELSKKYKKVIGIDRIILEESEYLLEKNWFDFIFKKQNWGSILSNMSFTNHLIYIMHNDKKNIFRYFLKYWEILNSLKINGKFIYAPSLPFIEEKLDQKRFEIITKKINENYSMTKIIRKCI